MDKIFIRNYILFLVIMLLCAGALCYGLISGDRQLQRTEDFLVQTQSVITETQQVAALIEGMIVLQRSFLLTNDPIFKDKYEYKKAQVSERIAYLNELTENNASQLSRLDEIRRYFTQFTTQIEERAHLYAKAPSPYGREFIDGLDQVDNLRDNIARLIDAMLAHEYDFFNKQIAFVSEKKDEYFNGLIIGVFTGTLFLLIFNAVLLRSQRRRTKIEASLKEAEERLALAIEGSRDGIFDWDIPAGKMFYSPRFFEMLGYERKAYKGTPQDFGDLLHPEDAERVWNHIEDYLRGDLAEYVQEFRMKHKSGRWVWIQARAKALYDRSGKAYRMVGAHADVTSMIQNQEKLENEKKLAEEANQAKSEFLAHMSHEIRTPLTAITGIAEIFEKNQSNLDEKQKRLVQTLGASASSLKDLINDILDFSKIESGELELVKEKFLLARVELGR